MADQSGPSTPSQGDYEPQPAAPPPKSPETTGLPRNVAAGLAVLFSIVGGIVFLVLEKKSSYVRFYAMQSLVLGALFLVLDIVLGVLARLPFIGTLFGLLSIVVGLGYLALWIITMVKAFTGVEWEIPYIGKQARKFLKTSPI